MIILYCRYYIVNLGMYHMNDIEGEFTKYIIYCMIIAITRMSNRWVRIGYSYGAIFILMLENYFLYLIEAE